MLRPLWNFREALLSTSQRFVIVARAGHVRRFALGCPSVVASHEKESRRQIQTNPDLYSGVRTRMWLHQRGIRFQCFFSQEDHFCTRSTIYMGEYPWSFWRGFQSQNI